jgi:molybdopterin-containing oxidoreductase family membrane subunit
LAWDITNFVWWVGIGHAGTISAVLLFRQRWRMAINRSAEAMTIFSVIKLVYFQLYMGRPWLAFWCLIPNQFGSLGKFNSPLLGMYLQFLLTFSFIGGLVCYLILQC